MTCPMNRVLWLAVAALLAGGCQLNGKPYVTPARMDHGLILILPGIEGPSPNSGGIRNGLMDAGLPQAMEIYNWGGLGGGAYAFHIDKSRKKAGEIVARIELYRQWHPGQPVVVIGHSGGGAIAVFVADAMGEGVRLRKGKPLSGLVTLAPAVSPTYNLSEAMIGCGGRMLNCYTSTDVGLRTLTTLGRNFDGVPGATAGQSGFKLPEGAPEARREAFDNLRQIEWSASMMKQGNVGGHSGWTSPKWVAKELAPIIRQWTATP
ncbi:MAG: hypothetical protein PHU85_15270 [Phycisphaerae bacterium]|nr:hypothetical protein [Phycisphaerae bacterium]